MIKSFKNKALKEFAATGNARKLSVHNIERVRRILLALDAAVSPEAMNLPGYKFHGLVGNRRGQYSVWASGNYRITFSFEGEDAVDVDLEDYHGK